MGAIRWSDRRAGASREINERFAEVALGVDPASCGCGVGVLVGRTPEGMIHILERTEIRCARHDVVEGVVTRGELA